MTWTSVGGTSWTSFTPVLTGSGGTNPSTFTATGSKNRYQKIGSLVIVRFGLHTPTSTGNGVGTGAWRLSGFPTPKHGSEYSACGYWYMYNSQDDPWNVGIYGSVVLHPNSQSTSTVEFVTLANEANTNLINVLPTSINYPTRYMDFSGQFFYEAL